MRITARRKDTGELVSIGFADHGRIAGPQEIFRSVFWIDGFPHYSDTPVANLVNMTSSGRYAHDAALLDRLGFDPMSVRTEDEHPSPEPEWASEVRFQRELADCGVLPI